MCPSIGWFVSKTTEKVMGGFSLKLENSLNGCVCVCVAVSVLLVEYVCTEVVSTAGSEGFLVSEVKSAVMMLLLMPVFVAGYLQCYWRVLLIMQHRAHS